MQTSLLLGLAIIVGAPGPKDPPKKEPTIVGEWTGESATSGGMALPVPQGGIKFTFTADGKLTVHEAGGGKGGEAGSYKIDPKATPAEIDLMPTTAGNGPTLLGIYKLDGDTLTMCFLPGGPGTERPKNFESPAGAQSIVMTFKRVKKD
jgi:uncharacterized protein (TIGR03067 family)